MQGSRRHFRCRLAGQVVEVKLSVCLVDDGGFAFRPTWEGEPDWFFVFVGKRPGVRDRGLFRVKVGHVEGAAQYLTVESTLKLEANSGFTRRKADSVEGTFRCHVALYGFVLRRGILVWRHQIVAQLLVRRIGPHKDSAIGQASVGPGVIAFVSEINSN